MAYTPFPPSPDEPLHITQNPVCNLVSTTTNMQLSGTNSVTWQRVSTHPALTWMQVGNDLEFNFWSVGQTALFRLSISNSCGIVENNYYFESISCGGGGGDDPCDPVEAYLISPNPVGKVINIVVTPNLPEPCSPPVVSRVGEQGDRASDPDLIIKVDVYDINGLLMRTKQFTSGVEKVNLDISDLRKGLYKLKITDQQYRELLQTIIKK